MDRLVHLFRLHTTFDDTYEENSRIMRADRCIECGQIENERMVYLSDTDAQLMDLVRGLREKQ